VGIVSAKAALLKQKATADPLARVPAVAFEH